LEDCHNKWVKFDGNTPHMTMPYKGGASRNFFEASTLAVRTVKVLCSLTPSHILEEVLGSVSFSSLEEADSNFSEEFGLCDATPK
jgi:hypothetical protein